MDHLIGRRTVQQTKVNPPLSTIFDHLVESSQVLEVEGLAIAVRPRKHRICPFDRYSPARHQIRDPFRSTVVRHADPIHPCINEQVDRNRCSEPLSERLEPLFGVGMKWSQPDSVSHQEFSFISGRVGHHQDWFRYSSFSQGESLIDTNNSKSKDFGQVVENRTDLFDSNTVGVVLCDSKQRKAGETLQFFHIVLDSLSYHFNPGICSQRIWNS